VALWKKVGCGPGWGCEGVAVLQRSNRPCFRLCTGPVRPRSPDTRSAPHRGPRKTGCAQAKPGAVRPPETAMDTHPRLLHALLEAFRALGLAELPLAKGPGHRRGTLDQAEAAGYLRGNSRVRTGFHGPERGGDYQNSPVGPFSRLNFLYLPDTAPGRGSAGVEAENEDAPLGRPDPGDEEPVQRSAGPHLWLAEERVTLGRHRGIDCRSSSTV